MSKRKKAMWRGTHFTPLDFAPGPCNASRDSIHESNPLSKTKDKLKELELGEEIYNDDNYNDEI
jgi:hypothetical protein